MTSTSASNLGYQDQPVLTQHGRDLAKIAQARAEMIGQEEGTQGWRSIALPWPFRLTVMFKVYNGPEERVDYMFPRPLQEASIRMNAELRRRAGLFHSTLRALFLRHPPQDGVIEHPTMGPLQYDQRLGEPTKRHTETSLPPKAWVEEP